MSKNLEALNDAPKHIRDSVVGVVDVLSQHLVERRWESLDEAAYRAWAAILADGAATDSERGLKAIATAFSFALHRSSDPVSPLVVVSFPTVYRQLPKLKQLGFARDLIPFAYSYWIRRKKAKDARRDLIDALVGAFLHSSWPPADLIVAAIEADVGRHVVKSVRKRFSGSRYLERISRDAKRLDDELCHRVLAYLPDTA